MFIATVGLGLTFCGAAYGLMELAMWLSWTFHWRPPFWAALMIGGIVVMIVGVNIDNLEGRNG